MTDKKEELIELDFPSIYDVKHYEIEPNEEYAWVREEPIGTEDFEDMPVYALMVFHLEVNWHPVSPEAQEFEERFIKKHSNLINRLKVQGVEVVTCLNYKSNGHLGVRVEHFPLGN